MPQRSWRWLVCLLVVWCGATSPLDAAPPAPQLTIDQRIDELLAVRSFKDVALSPDGRWLAWVEDVLQPDKPGVSPSAIFIADLKAETWSPARLGVAKGPVGYSDSEPAWSPDSRQIAFLSDRDQPGQLQLHVAGIGQNGPAAMCKRTKVAGHLTKPRFAPDGRTIAVLFTENSPRATGPTQPATVEVGVVGEAVYEQRLCLVQESSEKPRPVSPADLFIYEYDWSPDGKQLVAIAAPGDGDNNWYVAKLIAVEAASGRTRTLAEPKMQIAVPRWSPDGRSIAFIGGLMSDEGINGGDLYLVSPEGGPPRRLTPDLRGSAAWLAWDASSQEILFTAHVDGSSAILTADAQTGKTKTLWMGAEVIGGEGNGFSLSVSRDHKTTALFRHSVTRPPELWAGPIGEWRQRTHHNAARKPFWGEMKNLHWKSDNLTIQGWLLYPANYDPTQRYPMVMSIHGGPSGAKRPGWPGASFDFSLLSNDGYFVFFPNPRGSYGQGLAFTRGNVRDFGHGDLRDSLAGIDEIVHTLPVDPRRLGVVGWSYGGYMAMWTVTQTNRFRAAVAGAGIANWQSYYGQNGIDQWMLPFFGASVYDDPDVYARSSPMNFIKKVKTPTLVLVGERDLECPAPQSYEFWRGLRRLKVPTQLVVYAGEGHGIRKTENRRDILRRSAFWLNSALQPQPVPARMPDKLSY